MTSSRSEQARARLGVLGVAMAVTVLDQLTKAVIVASFELRERVPVVEGYFDLTYVTNPGGVWSVGAGLAGPLRTAIFLALPVLITAFAIWYSWSLPPAARFRQGAIALVVGGALGNLLDRLFRSPPEVVDFLLAHWRDVRHWPAFNVADAAICVGVGVLLVTSFVEDEEEEHEDVVPASEGSPAASPAGPRA